MRRPSIKFDHDGDLLGYSETDENAISDGEDLSAEFTSRSNSLSHESVLSATRLLPASLETMPDEILDLIFSLVTLDATKDRYLDPKVDLFACLQVSKSIHAAALRVLYRHVKMPQSKTFFKFSNSLSQDVNLGNLVQCLDFSHYSSIGFGRTRTTHTQVPYLTPKTLRACLERTTNLRAFLAHEHIDDELDANVLSKLFEMPSLCALDLTSCSSTSFTEALKSVCTIPAWGNLDNTRSFLNIERLSLHECTTVRAQVYESLLPRLNRLTHLDVAHTMINDKALMSIPHSARITHLNLQQCTQITGATVVKFLTQHPAITNSIVYLNLMADASRYRLLDEDDLHNLLPNLPQTLRSLNVGGARVNNSHVRYLRALATHLEELGLKGANLSLSGDVTQIMSLHSSSTENEVEHPEWRSSLRYIDLTDIASVSKMSLTYSPNTIIGNESVPLEVIELSASVITDISKSIKRQKDPEWTIRELGRRGWFVRQTGLLPKWLYTPDDGYRNWKMGARWWGMRKIPMFEQNTGGMYGYFMFKRN